MIRKLNPDADLEQFLRSVERCPGEVLFTTEAGDCLNLKSTLSVYVFAMLSGRKDLLAGGSINCASDADAEALEEYFL